MSCLFFFLSHSCFYLTTHCLTYRSLLAYGVALLQVGVCGDIQPVWTPGGTGTRAGRLCLTAFSNTSEVLSSTLSCKQIEQRMWRADNQRIGKEGFEKGNALGMRQEDNSLGLCPMAFFSHTWGKGIKLVICDWHEWSWIQLIKQKKNWRWWNIAKISMV